MNIRHVQRSFVFDKQFENWRIGIDLAEAQNLWMVHTFVARWQMIFGNMANKFLTNLNITLRRDHESKRPRINKEGSQMDREQKSSGKLYYS